MEDDDDDHKEVDYPLSNTSSTSYTQQNKIRINGSHVPQPTNKSISNNIQQNWCTFEDKNDVANEGHLTNDQLTGLGNLLKLFEIMFSRLLFGRIIS